MVVVGDSFESHITTSWEAQGVKTRASSTAVSKRLSLLTLSWKEISGELRSAARSISLAISRSRPRSWRNAWVEGILSSSKLGRDVWERVLLRSVKTCFKLSSAQSLGGDESGGGGGTREASDISRKVCNPWVRGPGGCGLWRGVWSRLRRSVVGFVFLHSAEWIVKVHLSQLLILHRSREKGKNVYHRRLHGHRFRREDEERKTRRRGRCPPSPPQDPRQRVPAIILSKWR